MEQERRRHRRDRPHEDIVAVFAPTPTLAKVVDLSVGGLCLEYFTGPKQERVWDQVNLFLTKSKAYLPAIAFRLVYDRQKHHDDQSPALLSRRVCGLEFKDLNSLQTAHLETLLLRQ